MIDYREKVAGYKTDIYNNIKAGDQTFDSVKQMVEDMIQLLNEVVTVTGKKYGDIFMKVEGKNIGGYASRIVSDPEYLLTENPRVVYNVKPRRNRSEKQIKSMVKRLEVDLLNNNKSIDVDEASKSNDKRVRDFSFDYENIRDIVPHDQMPTTDKDIDLFLLEWKSGKWMDIMNSYSYDLGYDWKKKKIKKFDQEMKRYQYDMLEVNNSGMNKMITNYLKTLSWMVDYYMNTDNESTKTVISTWSYGYERSPFITHVTKFMQNMEEQNLKKLVKGTYKKSLVTTDKYLTPELHRFYIYPLPTSVIAALPAKNQINFPDIMEYVKITIESVEKNSSKGGEKRKRERVFDCRMCPYFSKCIFKSESLDYKGLASLKIPKLIDTSRKVKKRKKD